MMSPRRGFFAGDALPSTSTPAPCIVTSSNILSVIRRHCMQDKVNPSGIQLYNTVKSLHCWLGQAAYILEK